MVLLLRGFLLAVGSEIDAAVCTGNEVPQKILPNDQSKLKMARFVILFAVLAALAAFAVAQPAADRVTSLPNLVRNSAAALVGG